MHRTGINIRSINSGREQNKWESETNERSAHVLILASEWYFIAVAVAVAAFSRSQ